MSDHPTHYHEHSDSKQHSSSPEKWNKWVRFFHWTTVVLLFVTWLMIVLHEQTDDANYVYIGLHKAFGVCVFVWTILRLYVRSRATDLPPVLGPLWQMKLAHYVHIGLYICLLLMPFTGFFMSEFANRSINMFGLFEIPVFVTPNKETSKIFKELHKDVVWPIFVILFFMHVGGVMYHQFIKKDPTLKRML